jgi:beta-ketoacyl synthase-like protein
MKLEFVVQQFAVWPPNGLDAKEVRAQQAELLSVIPTLLKRRLSPLARTVFCAAVQCIDPQNLVPTVFSSAHGELAKSFAMLEQIEAGEEISPTLFSLSVHNAIAGLFSIVFSNQLQSTVIAPGEEGVAPAFIEGLGLLNEGARQVLLVFYDEPLAPFYPDQPYKLTIDTTLALAVTISYKGRGQQIAMNKVDLMGEDTEQPVQLPLLIDFLAHGNSALEVKTARGGWCWSKCA